MNMNDAIGMTRKILNRQMPRDDEITAWIRHAEASVREIVREEIRNGPARWLAGHAVIDPKPKTDLAEDQIAESNRRVLKAEFDAMKASLKPKTDLERAAAECDAVTFQFQGGPPNAFRAGAVHAAHKCSYAVSRLKPQPDWRKIAEGLARSLRMSRAIISVSEERWDATTGANLAAYDAAVKETSLAEGARSKEADK